MNEKPVCGIPWYRQDQWEKWCEISMDPMSESYRQWLTAAEQIAEDLTRRGMEIHRVELDVDLFKDWLATQPGLKINGETRTDYANRLLEAKLGVMEN